MTKARASVIDPGVFRPGNPHIQPQQIFGSDPNAASAPVPSATAVAHDDLPVPGSKNPEITLNDQPTESKEHIGNGGPISGNGKSIDTTNFDTNKRPVVNLGTGVQQHLNAKPRSSASAERLRADYTTFDEFSSALSQFSSREERSSNGDDRPHDQVVMPPLNSQQAVQDASTGLDQNEVVVSSAQNNPATTSSIPTKILATM
ncbi:hypothetical protein BKA64DRAFT_150434 [Cadophora sp. MPI-SDFR-AT-0126]|nr:hypothetical protein BKA64DRAFT_150434 [Leotiomycetes sp. MPI-SDFR-AT-0126]